jgi:multidrug efflux pump subunit AcrB/ABC-type multidrug transport system ATPase subunit
VTGSRAAPMTFSLIGLPVRRPVATAMFFLALVLFGLFAWSRIPIELIPALSGDQLFVTFSRPGSEPDVVEREILLPLEARVGELPGLAETWGEINGGSGRLRLRFERGVNVKVRELELSNIAAELARTQPQGTWIRVSSQDLAAASRFAMIVQVTGGEDRNALRDLVDVRIQPGLAAVPGVSQVIANGGAPREVTIWVDPERCATLGVRPGQVMRLLEAAVRPLRSLGGVEQHGRRWQIVLDGRPAGLERLGELRIDPARPVLLRHVADIEMTTARVQSAYRIDGRDAAALVVYQEDGANLLELGRELRARVAALRAQWNPYGLDLRISVDAAEKVEEQIDRLQHLALSGFAIALVVLYLFLRELRAVAVVAVAGPVSLLIAGAMLHLGGYTLNLITMLGLVVGMGMLIDNSIVVFEAVQRGLERGLAADAAALAGVRRTVRAIVTASAANVVVFLPAMFLVEDSFTRGALELVAVGILLPLLASLVVAVGLVPLLAEKLAAPAAIARLEQQARWRRERGGAVPPQRVRALFSALLKNALRRPTAWIASVAVVIVLTLVIALPWVIVGSQARDPERADQVTMQIDLEGALSLAAATAVFERAEQAVLVLEGIASVEANVRENGGSLSVHFDAQARAAGAATPAQVRGEVQKAIAGLEHVSFRTVRNTDPDAGEREDDAEVLVSGPDMAQLDLLAREIQSRLKSIPGIGETWVSSRAGREEVRVEPLLSALAPHRLYPEDVLSVLILSRREGVRLPVGFTLADGRELPLTVRSPDAADAAALDTVAMLRFATEQGSVRLGAVTETRRVTPPTSIAHHNGRRELAIGYALDAGAPAAGPARVGLERAIEDGVANAYRPPGYTVEAVSSDGSSRWLKLVFVPILLLLFAVLAIAFESLTMPLLVLVAVPLTALGATWALALAGVGVDLYALVGVIALLGLTVNPAILLVDRMQQRVRTSGCSGGTAAIAAARERTRPVLMTSCVTIAGLWPLSLSTGEELEIWPPFATVVMGGLATSTLLTLLVIPVGFVLFYRIERILGRLGPWMLLGWVGATAAVAAPLIYTERLNSLTWQIITTLLIAGAFLWLMLRLFAREPRLAMDAAAPRVETRFLSKVYGLPGPIRKAWQLGRGGDRHGHAPHRRDASERALVMGLLFAGSAYLATHVESLPWRVVFAYVCAAFAARAVIALRDVMHPPGGAASAAQRERRARFGRLALAASPFVMLALLYLHYSALPLLAGEPAAVPASAVALLAVVTLVVQLGRATARRAAVAPARDEPSGRLRAAWRRTCVALFGFDLPRAQVQALATTSFSARQGMIGILGPNGAGKTTLLRVLAGVIETSSGTVHYGGFLKRRAGDYVSRWVGYLPQEFGLPDHMTAQEYLDYFALLYEVGDRAARASRVAGLLADVGLLERRHEKIGGYSGGMRQRVAIARTLLREPPIIIVDEPTVGLDPRERIRFRNLLAKLAEGRVVLFSTHVVEDVAVSCQRVIVMKRGRIVFDGAPDELAQLAAGRTWELRLAAGAEVELPDTCSLVDQGPEADGGSRLRILGDAPPHPDATPAEPGIEDGYLQLMHRGPAHAA